jgi:hypothetical protein
MADWRHFLFSPTGYKYMEGDLFPVIIESGGTSYTPPGIERRNIFRNKNDREDFLERLAGAGPCGMMFVRDA